MIKVICQQCGRSIYADDNCVHNGQVFSAAYSYVVHDFYGCDSGCCGHIAYLCDEKNNIIQRSEFEFTHPYGKPYDSWAIEFCKHIWPDAPVNLEYCDVSEY